jgi:acyl transferase domain-containing protein
VTAEPLTHVDARGVVDILVEQLVTPVRLRAAVELLHRRGCRLFLQCGPKRSLSTFVDDILAERDHAAEATLHPKVGEAQQLTRAVAWCFVHRADRTAAPPSPPA